MERAGPADLADLSGCRTKCKLYTTLQTEFSVRLISIRSGFILTVQDRMSVMAFVVFVTSDSVASVYTYPSNCLEISYISHLQLNMIPFFAYQVILCLSVQKM